MKILTREQLEKLPTKRLLAYKNRLLKVSDDTLMEDGVLLRTSTIWQQTYAALKEILSTREHLDRD